MKNNKIQLVNGLSFDELIQSAPGPVLVDFSAAWCAPCKTQSKILDRLAEQNEEVTIGMVDVDESPELVARFEVRGMPTLLAFRDGKETGRRLGLTNEQGIRALVGGTT
jgi:thioredoxin 1